MTEDNKDALHLALENMISQATDHPSLDCVQLLLDIGHPVTQNHIEIARHYKGNPLVLTGLLSKP
jgi:hypothetical protein